MMCAFWQPTTPWAQVWKKAHALMDVVLHLGAHRTASTSFQHYMRSHMGDLQAVGIAFWGPLRTRKGLFDGLSLQSGCVGVEKRRQRGTGRVQLQLERQQRMGVHHLIVSDENMIGSVRENMRRERLYPSIGERVARFAQAFDGPLNKVVLSIRALDTYWASGLAYGVARGAQVPTEADLDRLVTQPRSWRDVITDLACALPAGVDILVAPFERLAGRPDDMLEYMTDGVITAPRRDTENWRNKAPDLTELRTILQDRQEHTSLLPTGENGVWHPFNEMQTAALRETYADDLFWLRAGADGLALLIEEGGPDMTGWNPAAAPMTRGQEHGRQKRLVDARRERVARTPA